MDCSTVASCVTTCVVIYTIFSIVKKFGRWRHFYKQASKFPGPRTLPFIGNAHLFVGGTEDIFNKFNRMGKLYPSPYRLWLGNYLTFVVNAPEQVKVLLLSPKSISKAEFYKFARPWLGTGLLTASVAKWQVHRKLIQPTFGSKILESFVGIFSAQSTTLAKEMERNSGGPEFEIYEYTSQYTLRTVCETTMGVKLDAHANSDGCYAEAIKKMIAGLCRRMVSPWLHPNFIFNRTQLGKDQQRLIKFLHNFTNNVIQRKKEEQSRRRGLADNDEETSNWSSRKKAFLDHLMEASCDSEVLSDEALREEVDTMMLTGSDTTATISSFVMLMLASHPEIQDQVYRELCEIYKDDDSEELHLTWEDLTRMTYMDRVIKETMRLFPISPLLMRSVTDDLDIGEHTFPAGSLVFLSMMELHRNGDIWPDPLKFDPDRFLPEEVKKRDPYTYLPFGGGPRYCIGAKYAMMSMKTLLATILHRYVLKKDNIISVKDIRFKWEFVLRPVDPFTLRIDIRTRKNASI